MTTEEFYEIARQNNAIMTPEESEQCRRETREFLERYQLNVDWLGSPYFVDTHNPIHVFADKCYTGISFFGFVSFIFWTIVYVPIIAIVLLVLLLCVF
ncbi:MAG: hypothetical protein LBP87_08240 [Planctomycetaceae bacterium]|nr:hypothetical protein [Planctomycetaceae bacterium]